MGRAKKLRQLLDGGKIILAPGAYDAWSGGGGGRGEGGGGSGRRAGFRGGT